jgi:hypothetical protein
MARLPERSEVQRAINMHQWRSAKWTLAKHLSPSLQIDVQITAPILRPFLKDNDVLVPFYNHTVV